MKIAVVSYSFTGNNSRYAGFLASKLQAEEIRVCTKRPVSIGTIMLDLILQRKPEIDLAVDALFAYDLILFVAPVWMGQVAFPMRRCLDAIKSRPCSYAFLSISGGADGGNPKLFDELKRRTGLTPALLLDQHIRTLLPASPAPARKDTSTYKLTDDDCAKIAAIAADAVKNRFPNAL